MPDNAVYFHVAYLAAAIVYGGYIVTLVVRGRRARDRQRRRSGGEGVARAKKT